MRSQTLVVIQIRTPKTQNGACRTTQPRRYVQ